MSFFSMKVHMIFSVKNHNLLLYFELYCYMLSLKTPKYTTTAPPYWNFLEQAVCQRIGA